MRTQNELRLAIMCEIRRPLTDEEQEALTTLKKRTRDAQRASERYQNDPAFRDRQRQHALDYWRRRRSAG